MNTCSKCTEGWIIYMYPRPGGNPGNSRLPCKACNEDGSKPDPWPKPTVSFVPWTGGGLATTTTTTNDDGSVLTTTVTVAVYGGEVDAKSE